MENTNQQELNRSFYRMVFTLVIPMALQNLINVGVTAADVIMLGAVGEDVLSGASLAGQVQFILSLIFFGLTSGAAVLTSQYWGKGDVKTIEKVLGISLRFSIIAGVVFTVIVLLIPEAVMKIFTNDAQVIEYGAQYLRIISFTYIFMSVTMVYLNIMRSVERVIISTLVYSASLFINVVLNAIFIFGLLGFPQMGIKGAAIATLIARIVEFIIVMVYAKTINKQIRFRLCNIFVRDKALMKDFLTYALPVLLNELMWGAGTSTYAAILGHLGQSATAANSVAQTTRQLSMVISFGLANATAIMVGKALGENKRDLAKIYASKFLRLSIFLGLGGAIVILLVSPIARHYLSLGDTASEYLKYMMYVMSYFAFAQSINTTCVVGIFRGGGDTKFGLVLDMSTMWGCSILIGFIGAFVLKLPVPLVYVLLMSDEVIKIPLVFQRYRKYKWLRNVTR